MKQEDFHSLEFDTPSPAVLRITMRHENGNTSVTEQMHTELSRIWPIIQADPHVRAVVLRGEGGTFGTGGSLDLVRKIMDSHETRIRLWNETRAIAYGMINCTKPIVTSIAGAAYGAGLACALFADISIAAKNANLVDSHTLVGVPAGDGAAMIWPLLCGMAKAKYYLLLNRKLSGEDAERIGLVSLAVDEQELDGVALDAGRRLAEGPPEAIQLTKYTLNNWLRLAGPTFDTSLALEFLAFCSPEAQEGLASTLEKRRGKYQAPNF